VYRRLVIVALLGSAAAHADNGKLAEARAELAAVHYDRARVLLVEALDAGGNSPAEVREIYQLAASTEVVLGHPELGEQLYRRLLALDPKATLGADEPPKMHAPFESAQAYIHAHGGLVVTATVTAAGTDVAVLADPIVMASAAAFAGETPVRFDAGRRARLASRSGRVAILDEHGNHLVEIDVAVPVATTSAPPVTFDAPTSSRRWLVWGVPAGVFVGTAIGFGITALAYQNEAGDAVTHSGDHFASDVSHDRDRARVFAYVSAGTFALGIALAIPAAYAFPRHVKPSNAGIAIAF
jgi:hypothetical protein